MSSKAPRVLHVTYHEQWTWEEFRAANYQMLNLIAAMPRVPLHLIHDLTEGPRLPRGEVVMETYQMVNTFTDHKLHLYGVGVPPIYHAQIEAGLRLTGQARIVWLSSMDDALSLVHTHQIQGDTNSVRLN